MESVALDILVLTKDELLSYKESIDLFLASIFDSQVQIDISQELHCGALILHGNEIVACGFAYVRTMFQGEYQFTAAILGAIAVSKKHRGKGLCKNILAQLEEQLKMATVSHVFLFAYQPKTYQSTGYALLDAPINYFDKTQQKWNTFVYRGGMTKALGERQLSKKQKIEFQGCVY